MQHYGIIDVYVVLEHVHNNVMRKQILSEYLPFYICRLILFILCRQGCLYKLINQQITISITTRISFQELFYHTDLFFARKIPAASLLLIRMLPIENRPKMRPRICHVSMA